ncbi:chemotaxis protein [Xanthomonas sp. H13-6]|uniref:Chemotaxis protein n=1 Tax=Xanthomonas chitinilytica TaxID=2989819 RepID=A0ABT3K088_9XANT|nr:chemotaxis protein CheB [Xanthomonas sp. H13-6]MCW4473899.1 chemotaxis protein [Xanthomonas sp. H13-6]
MPVNDIDSGKPVALLARPGQARERLREAVSHAGGHIVLEDDPTTLEPQTLDDAAPAVVLIALEPAIEDALERLEPALGASHLTLIFDEAELAARREGWEAQRWVRHLAAKLHGHDNVLPPGHENETSPQPEPGLPVTPAQLHSDAPLEFHLEEAVDAAPALPGDGLYAPPAAPAPTLAEVAAEPVAAPVAATPPPLPAAPDFSSWSLVEDDALVAPAAAVAAPAEPAAEFSTGGLSLLELEPEGTAEAGGALLVLAGIGGPDAVRRLLAALPETFNRPVLVQLRLDGGRYGNLVKQMARVTPLPVTLAEAGQPVEAAQIYILPDDVGVSCAEDRLRFVAGAGGTQVVAALPAAQSAVLMLSGADQAQVDDVLAVAAQGGWVGGQIGEGCYDPGAASRLAVAGMPAGDPVQLAQALSEHWGA